MSLPLGWSLLLIAAGAWNLIVWPPFLRRVLKDPRSRDDQGRATRFFTVHAVLVGVSLLLGVAVGALGLMTLF